MTLMLVFLAVVYIIGRLVYWLVIDREVPGGWGRRFGVDEGLPPDVGQWKEDGESEEGRAAVHLGLRREVRLFQYLESGKLVQQARSRNPATNAVVRVERDIPVRRRRVKV